MAIKKQIDWSKETVAVKKIPYNPRQEICMSFFALKLKVKPRRKKFKVKRGPRPDVTPCRMGRGKIA